MGLEEATSAFTRYLSVGEGLEAATVAPMPNRLRYAVKDGLNLDRFLAGPAAALEEGSRYLEDRKLGAARQAYGNSVKLLNALARWRRYDGLHWTGPKDLPSEPSVIQDHDLRRLLDHPGQADLRHIRDAALLEWAVATGLRGGELAGQLLEDVDVDRGTYTVRNPTKRGRRRTCPILFPNVLEPDSWFMLYLETRKTWRTPHREVWVSLGRPPSPMTGKDLYGCLWRFGRAYGVPLSFFRTRHTFATKCKKAGVDTRDLQVLMGHASIKSTVRYDDRTAQDVADALQGLRIRGWR